jgi:hypothetical protein
MFLYPKLVNCVSRVLRGYAAEVRVRSSNQSQKL